MRKKKKEKKMEVPDNVKFFRWFYKKIPVYIKITFKPEQAGVHLRYLQEPEKEFYTKEEFQQLIHKNKGEDVTDYFKEFLKTD